MHVTNACSAALAPSSILDLRGLHRFSIARLEHLRLSAARRVSFCALVLVPGSPLAALRGRLLRTVGHMDEIVSRRPPRLNMSIRCTACQAVRTSTYVGGAGRDGLCMSGALTSASCGSWGVQAAHCGGSAMGISWSQYWTAAGGGFVETCPNVLSAQVHCCMGMTTMLSATSVPISTEHFCVRPHFSNSRVPGPPSPFSRQTCVPRRSLFSLDRYLLNCAGGYAEASVMAGIVTRSHPGFGVRLGALCSASVGMVREMVRSSSLACSGRRVPFWQTVRIAHMGDRAMST